jgi:hypothetical protein
MTRGGWPAAISRLALAAALLNACAQEAEAPTAAITATATISATSALPPPAGTAPGGTPSGYAASCAAGYPWGRQVTRAFVCIEAPQSGTTVTRGQSVMIRGYAGGSFENNVVVELHDANGNVPVKEPLTYTAPDVGMPGFWEIRVLVPVGMPLGPARIVVYFASPRDGGIVALASVELRVQ